MRGIKTIGLAIAGASAFTVLEIGCLSASANAATLTTSDSFNFDSFDILNEAIPIQQFNPSLGTLNSVLVKFTGTMTGEAGFENRNATPATVTVNFGGLFSLTLPSGDRLDINPSNQQSYNVTRFDRVFDYGGTSGRTLESLTASATTSQSYISNALLQALTGTGVANFLFSAIYNSSVTGPGNIVSYSTGGTSVADVSVTYDYTPATTPTIPTPALLPGLIGIGVAALRKRKEQAETVEA